MFTLERIEAAQAKVDSNADFARFVRELKEMGVERYEAHMADGHVEYYGLGGTYVQTRSKFASVPVAPSVDFERMKGSLRAYRRDSTDFVTFFKDMAGAGVSKYVVDIDAMTSTYYDAVGGVIVSDIVARP